MREYLKNMEIFNQEKTKQMEDVIAVFNIVVQLLSHV